MDGHSGDGPFPGRRFFDFCPAGVIDHDLAEAGDFVLAVGADPDGRGLVDPDADESGTFENDADQPVAPAPDLEPGLRLRLPKGSPTPLSTQSRLPTSEKSISFLPPVFVPLS